MLSFLCMDACLIPIDNETILGFFLRFSRFPGMGGLSLKVFPSGNKHGWKKNGGNVELLKCHSWISLGESSRVLVSSISAHLIWSSS